MEHFTQSPETPRLTDEQVAELQRLGRLLVREADSTLIAEADETTFVLLIRNGYVKAVTQSGSTARRSKQARIVGLHGPDAIVGEMATITDRPRSADIVTLSRVEAVQIDGDTWSSFLDRHPTVLMELYRIALIRLARAKNGDESRLNSEQKLAKALLEIISSGMGIETDNGVQFRNISQRDLAGFAGISRESAAQAIRRLKDAGALTTGREKITITDVDTILSTFANDPGETA